MGALERTTAGEQWTNLAETWHEATRLDLLDLLPPTTGWQRPQGALAATRFDMVAARGAADGTALEEASRAFDKMGAPLYAAEAAAAAASAYRKAGNVKDATRLDGTAGALLAKVATVAKVSNIATPLLAGRSSSGPLSAREREIAGLAALGLSNRQIADRLIVSERTVENHLYRVFIKLGVDGRDELAGVLHP